MRPRFVIGLAGMLALGVLLTVSPTHGQADAAFEKIVVDPTPPTNPWVKVVGDFSGDGHPDIAVGGSSGPLVWYRYPDWRKTQIAAGGYHTVGGQAADIDADGDLDLVIGAEFWYENPRPNGEPTAGEWTAHRISELHTHDVEVADLDNDGSIDLVARDQSGFGHNAGNKVHIYRRARGVVWTYESLECPHGEGIRVGDLDRDGDADIVLGGMWFENRSTRAAMAWAPHRFAEWPGDAAVALADVNVDGRMDVVLSQSEGAHKLSWFEAPADPTAGGWAEHVIDGSVDFAHGIGTADVDRDGDLDIITAEMHQSERDRVLVYVNEGGGRRWRQIVTATTGSHGVQVADFDRDGMPDFMGANHATNSPTRGAVELFRNRLPAPQKRSLDQWQRHVIDAERPWRAVFLHPGDMDRDGKLDLIGGGWWWRNPAALAGQWERRPHGEPLKNVAAVHDFDGDGDLDVLGTQGEGANSNSDMLWARNDGRGGFTILTNIEKADGDFLQGVAVARFNPGGPLEAALSWHQADRGIQMLTVPANPSEDVWKWRKISETSQDEQLSAGDIDRDGDVDLFLGTRWLRNDGDVWTAFVVHPTSGSPDRNCLADVNGDGRLDAVVGFEAISAPGKLAWYEQPADATQAWTEHLIDMPIGPMALDVADIDGDGDLDISLGEHNLRNPDSPRTLVYENLDGKGVLWQSHLVSVGDEHHDGALLADMDGDGDLDIISVGWGHPRVLIFENRAQ